MKGSLTVEASYIFPICFLLIGVVCLLGVFLYDQSVLKLSGYECILQTVNEKEEISDEKLEKYARKCVDDRVLGVKNLKVDVKTTTSKISISFRGEQAVLNVPVVVTVVYQRTFPELILRLTR